MTEKIKDTGSSPEQIHDQIKVMRERRRRQFIGLFAGIGLGLMVSSAVPAIRENVPLTTVIIWSGALGTALLAFDQFEIAGAALTRSGNKILNYAVGLGLPLILLIFIQLFLGR